MEILNLISDIYNFFLPSSDAIQYAFSPIPLISGALSLGSGIYGMFKKGQAGKELDAATEQAVADQKGFNAKNQELADWYNSEASKDFMDTDVAQSTIGKVRDQYKRSLETNASNAARGGATAEAQVATKGKLNEGYNSVLNNMVGYGTQYKNSMKQGYGNMLSRVGAGINQVNQMNIGNKQAKVNSWGNQSNNALSGFSSIMGNTDWTDYFKKG